MKLRLLILFGRLLPSKMFLSLILWYKTGEIMSFRHPKTMNQKLQWKKIYGYDPIHDVIADKITVRKYVSERIGEQFLVPLIAIFDSPADIDLKILPKAFVMKSNNASAMLKIVKDKDKEDLAQLKLMTKPWFNNDYHFWTKEKQYEKIETKIMVEQLLKGDEEEVPDDYKLHCFSGRVEAIQVDKGRFTTPKRAMYTPSWEKLPFTWGIGNRKQCYLEDIEDQKAPNKLKEMIALAEVLSKDYDYIRVDFYISEGKLYFGEMTLHPTSGYKRFYPAQYNRIWGKMIKEPQG